MLKVYALARVTPPALRQLLASMDITCSSTTPQPAVLQQPAGTAKQPRSVNGSSAGAKAAALTQPTAAGLAGASGPTDSSAAGAGADGQTDVPPDEVLSGSNIYSTAEACLLAWMQIHAARAFPKLVGRTVALILLQEAEP